MNREFWRGKRVLITGHTGFKGGWLSLWLAHVGAQVAGYSLAPEADQPNLSSLCAVPEFLASQCLDDIRNRTALRRYLQDFKPEIVIHMAAQALVRASYEQPIETFETNVIGTVNILEAVRGTPSVRAVVNVTTDKCYENRELAYGYAENDPLGGADPYSASKACSELVSAAYRSSYGKEAGAALIATARAGNVIGGGDWSRDRIIPDCVRAIASRQELVIRNPEAVRPWQHVLDALAGYLMLAERLVTGDASFAEPWNFGPAAESQKTVRWLLSTFAEHYGAVCPIRHDQTRQPHETKSLMLDASKAEQRLGWRAHLDADEALRWTAEWYREALAQSSAARSVTLKQIEMYQSKCS
jgi:CDP-glucose 4,6-dehydratase